MIIRILSRINKVLVWFACGVLGLMMLLAVANILLRACGHPIKGTFELLGFGGAIAVALSLGGTQKGRGHIEVNLFESMLPPRVRNYLAIISSLLSLGFWGVVAWRLFSLAISLKQSGELSETLNIPYYPVVLVVDAGVVFMLVIILYQILLEKRGE